TSTDGEQASMAPRRGRGPYFSARNLFDQSLPEAVRMAMTPQSCSGRPESFDETDPAATPPLRPTRHRDRPIDDESRARPAFVTVTRRKSGRPITPPLG